MKKLLFVLTAFTFFFFGCEKNYDEVIQPSVGSYQVISLNSFSEFFYNPTDSTLKLSIGFRSSDKISNAFANVYSSESKKINTDPVQLFDDGTAEHGDAVKNDNKYSNLFPLSQTYPNGKYVIEYFVTDNSGETKTAAVLNFTYSNGQSNFAPVISNLIMPNSIGRENKFSFSVEVTDLNGASDITDVYYELFRPDGSLVSNSQGISKFPMFDDGNTQSNGDQIADDRRYTVVLTFPESVATGQWKFEFSARDRANFLSNKIIHILEVL